MDGIQDVLIIATVFGSGVLIVFLSLLYHYRKEQMRSKERLMAIEKGIAPKDLLVNDNNGGNCKTYANRRESEIYGGIKVFIIGLFLALALYYSAGGDHYSAAVWGLFVSGIGLAKIIVGILMRRDAASTTES
jgi:hypothetical protein